ncbi:MAG: nuclear transport factor 2 family protein [Chitinophagaceae bacterium]
MKSRFFLLSFLFLVGAMANNVNAQSASDSLYEEIARMDSIMFNAFNTRNIDQFKSLFAEDLEFYHDQGGLTDYNHTVDFMKDVAKNNNQLKRELVKGSLEVYPIPGYGAMEIGQHTFCHLENGKQDCGTFKFVHVWQKKNNEWKITRVISYGH